jgi:type III restriction enzyme
VIALKDYQHRVLDSLRDFLRQCSEGGLPEAAFQAVLERNEMPVVPYFSAQAAGLTQNLPYVCLRVPTGGGKTLLACHSIGIAMRELLLAERSVVLWLVPSNTILDQTANALRDLRHPYRLALETACGAVEVVTIEEALRLSRATVDGQTVVIVATIQAFRVEDTTGRKVYDQNGAFAEHMLNVPASRAPDLLPGADGKPKPSLVNMLRLRRPIVIVDEAHNARTDLSFASLGNVLPSCIIEFTATPARGENRSNILHQVSAAELKAAEMVKLPLRVITRSLDQKDQLLSDAITLRRDLQKRAEAETQETGEYLRPILLIQAENVEACEPLRERLISEFGLQRDQIKISTGTLDELEGVRDISSAKCPITFVITVKKLGEGWDCPFAYVLCSLRETHSATAIEQIVGRILRLPGVKTKRHPDLNCAYAFSISPSINEVLAELREALENNGFTRVEAERIIIPVPQGVLPFGAQPETVRLEPREIDVAVAQAQVEALAGRVRIDPAKGEITVLVPLEKSEVDGLVSCVRSPEGQALVRETASIMRDREMAFGGTGRSRQPSASELQLDFLIPLLCVRENGNLFEFESTFLLEHPWRLSQKDASLSKEYNPSLRPAGRAGVIDVGRKGEVETTALPEGHASDFVATLHQEVLALGNDGDWTAEKLIVWLDWQLHHDGNDDILPAESAIFLQKVIRGLMKKFSIADVSTLALDKFRLRSEIEKRIQQHRESERKAAFQAFLLPDSSLTVDATQAINFKTISYEPSSLYDGGHQFQKHYFGSKPGELPSHLTEEFKCAQFIDDLKEVKFWVRNLARKPSSFKLQTSTDYFYPDFICQLEDGRVLVVEYKGEHLYTAADAEEKRAIGEVWAARSNGKCLFVMPTAKNFAEITAAILTPRAGR